MHLNLAENNLKKGVLGLVMALVEIITDVLRIQATKRIEVGSLDDEEIERLGLALMELDRAVEDIKVTNGIADEVHSVRVGLDNLVDDVISRMITEPLEKMRGS
jgi:hypothetical protein